MNHFSVNKKLLFFLFMFIMSARLVFAQTTTDSSATAALPEALQPGAEQGTIDPVPGHGPNSEGSAGIAIVGPTQESKSAATAAADGCFCLFSGYHDGNTGKDLMLPGRPEQSGPSSVTSSPPEPSVDPETTSSPSAKGVDSHANHDVFFSGFERLYGSLFPALPDGSPDFEHGPAFSWSPTSSPELIGGAHRLCIYRVCNPDLSLFSNRDGNKYILGGIGVDGWDPFRSGGTGSRYCIAGQQCVIDWVLPDGTLALLGQDIFQTAGSLDAGAIEGSLDSSDGIENAGLLDSIR